jgi:hypothetical protein
VRVDEAGGEEHSRAIDPGRIRGCAREIGFGSDRGDPPVADEQGGAAYGAAGVLAIGRRGADTGGDRARAREEDGRIGSVQEASKGWRTYCGSGRPSDRAGE